MTSNALKINEEKTEFIIFNSTNVPSTSYRLQIGDNSKGTPVTNQMVTGSRLTGNIVNVMRSPVIERLMVRDSQVTLNNVIHDMIQGRW